MSPSSQINTIKHFIIKKVEKQIPTCKNIKDFFHATMAELVDAQH